MALGSNIAEFESAIGNMSQSSFVVTDFLTAIDECKKDKIPVSILLEIIQRTLGDIEQKNNDDHILRNLSFLLDESAFKAQSQYLSYIINHISELVQTQKVRLEISMMGNDISELAKTTKGLTTDTQKWADEFKNKNFSLEDFKKDVDEITKKQEVETRTSFDNFVKKTDGMIKEQEKKTNQLLPQFVTIVGIFIAIIMVMFGGLNIFSALANLENVSPLRLTGAGTLIAFLISNSMFLLIYLLSRLTNRPIHTVCVYFDNEKITNPL